MLVNTNTHTHTHITVESLAQDLKELIKEKIDNRYVTANGGEQVLMVSWVDLQCCANTLKVLWKLEQDIANKSGQVLDVVPMPATP